MAGLREPAGSREPGGLRKPRDFRRGFTLVELVIVIIITGVLGSLVSRFIATPLIGYNDLARRAALVDMADLALRRMARDVRAALPNSLRVVSGETLELIHTVDGTRYRGDPGVNAGADHTAASDWLSFATGGDAEWNAIGRLAALDFSYGTPLAAGHRIALYTTGPSVYTDASSDANPGSITPAATQITITDDTDEDHVLLSSVFEFVFASPQQRMFIVDQPIMYQCNTTAQTLTRFAGYSITASQPTNPSVSPLSGANQAAVAQYVTGCSFTYLAGSAVRDGLLTIRLDLSDSGETIRLLRQVRVDNAP